MIEINNLSSGWGKKQIFDGFSLSFEKGKLTALIGPNGSGKSTLLKTIIGIVPACSGEITADSINITKLNSRERARKIAYLAQDKNVPNMTLEELVLSGRYPHLHYPKKYSAEDKKTAQRAIELLGLSELAKSKLSELSGGIRQNAWIAMALAQETDYILLDEPTSFLDISHQGELMKTLKKLSSEGKGIVAVMHDLPLAFTLSDRVAVINNGSLLINDTPDAVCASGVIKNLFGTELCHLDNGSYAYNYGEIL